MAVVGRKQALVGQPAEDVASDRLRRAVLICDLLGPGQGAPDAARVIASAAPYPRRVALLPLAQVERSGTGPHTLWTGDLGAALFAADCLEQRAQVPIVDYI